MYIMQMAMHTLMPPKIRQISIDSFPEYVYILIQ